MEFSYASTFSGVASARPFHGFSADLFSFGNRYSLWHWPQDMAPSGTLLASSPTAFTKNWRMALEPSAGLFSWQS